MKTGILVCRYQCHYLHEAHIKLIDYVKERNEKVIIYIGVADTRLTHPDPLDFESRKIMVHELYPDITVLPIKNQKENYRWSINLDNDILKNTNLFDDITLYGSRESFLDTYYGSYNKEFVKDVVIEGLSATNIRCEVHKSKIDNRDKRQAVIWASNHRYPTSYQTVDVAIINFDKGELLLGKKLYENKFRFVGGFSDPENEDDTCLEAVGKREVNEECGYIETSNYKYICSMRIDDWRYGSSRDKIMTTFFACSYIFGKCSPRDDIHELQWFDINALTEDMFEQEHIQLYKELINYLKK